MARGGTVTARLAAWTALGFAGCFAQHTVPPGDAGPDGGSADGGSELCVRLASSADGSPCCLEERPRGSASRCADFGPSWTEGRCDAYPACRPVEPTCAGVAPPCQRVDAEGRCVGAVPPTCDEATGRWRCPAGSVPEAECPPARCEELGLAGCVSAPGCVPVFDDACCPVCSPSTICADCTDWEFFACLPREEACDPAIDACWRAMDGACEGRAPDCAGVAPTSERSCAVPGCVVQQSPPCEDCIPIRTCVPHRGLDSCEADCLEAPAECGPGWVPEAAAGCFTGNCLPESACR